MAQDPYEPIPVYAPVTVTRIVRRIVAWHGICRACGRTFTGKTRTRQTCNQSCRSKLVRIRRRQQELEQEQAEELRIQQAEARLGRVRGGRGR